MTRLISRNWKRSTKVSILPLDVLMHHSNAPISPIALPARTQVQRIGAFTQSRSRPASKIGGIRASAHGKVQAGVRGHVPPCHGPPGLAALPLGCVELRRVMMRRSIDCPSHSITHTSCSSPHRRVYQHRVSILQGHDERRRQGAQHGRCGIRCIDRYCSQW